MWYEPLLERGLVPDPILRAGIRAQLRGRLRLEERAAGTADRARLVAALATGPIARETDSANEQHYEVPVEFFTTVLAEHRKYSCALWTEQTPTLADAERAMLELYIERAGLRDGQSILDLGCGWGSLSLYLAEWLPNAEITSVSNSAFQIGHIQRTASERGLHNLTARRANINEFEPGRRFDRVASIEMFEHMNNFHELLRRISTWLEPDGRLFVHHFAHRKYAYPFVADNGNEWMARHFFTGGVMPNVEFLDNFQEYMHVAERWTVNGKHYQRTCEAWLDTMDRRSDEVRDILVAAYGNADATRHFAYWRIFFMACAELFGYRDGEEWLVVHSLLQPAG